MPKPILLFEFVSHYGGSARIPLEAMKHIKEQFPVKALDPYGCCDEYTEALEGCGIPYDVVMPEAKRQIIGKGSLLKRSMRMLASSREMLQFTRKLRVKLLEIDPAVIWVNSERAMFFVERAVGDKYPVIKFVHGDISANLKWYCMKAWRKIGKIVGINKDCLKYFDKYGWAKGKLVVSYNGIDLDRVRGIADGPVPDLPGDDKKFKIVMPASLIPYKAHSYAIRAMAILKDMGKDATLWICGDSPDYVPPSYKESLLNLRKELGLESNVHFLGWRKDVPAIMKKADVTLMTSDSLEGLPCVILESMALAVPVVVTPIGGIPEVVKDGETGFIIETASAQSAADALKKIMDDQLREKMGDLGQKMIEKDFTVQKQAMEFLEISKSVIKS